MDATVGQGELAARILDATMPAGLLIGLDRDPEAVTASRLRLARFGTRVRLVEGDFKDLPRHLASLGVTEVDGIVFDLGMSSAQLDDARRGFSFLVEGPLDMRMNQGGGEPAAEVLARLPEAQLADLIYRYGEERYSRRIARAIARVRAVHPIRTTTELVAVIRDAVPAAYRRGRLHCATRTFQALRIAVNRELEGLDVAVRQAAETLAPGGRLCVISFHSLEDRIVKHTLRALSHGEGAVLTLLTKKPQVPSERECRENPRARSAKLRVAERLPGRRAA